MVRFAIRSLLVFGFILATVLIPQSQGPLAPKTAFAASCTLTVGSPYVYTSGTTKYVRANYTVSCNAYVSSIQVSTQLVGPNGGTGSFSCPTPPYTQVKVCSGYYQRTYVSGQWQARGSATAPGWSSGTVSNPSGTGTVNL